MQKYKIIEQAIAQNDIEALREAVGSICYASRDFSSGEFDEVVRYIESKGIKLKDDTLIGPPTISSQKNTFTEEDFTRAVFELKKNFCDERIRDVKKIGKILYGVTNNTKDAIQERSTSHKAKDNNDLSPKVLGHTHRRMMIIVILCVVAIILILTILAIMKSGMDVTVINTAIVAMKTELVHKTLQNYIGRISIRITKMFL